MTTTQTPYKEGKSVTEQALLVRLTVSTWGGSVVDKDVSREVAQRAGANGSPSDVGSYGKKLLHKRALKDISNLASQMRDLHYDYTMPWDDGSYRLLPIALHAGYVREMDKLIDARMDAVNKLLANWDDHLEEAKQRLGTLFDEGDYPTRGQITSKLKASYNFSPVPDARHFAVAAMTHDVKEQLQDDFEKQVQAKIQGTVVHLYQRLKDASGAIVERLTDPDDEDAKPKIFRNTLIDNMRGVVDLIPALNLTDDPTLAAMGEDIRAALDGVTADMLRPKHKQFDADKREHVKQSVGAVFDRLSGYFGETPA